MALDVVTQGSNDFEQPALCVDSKKVDKIESAYIETRRLREPKPFWQKLPVFLKYQFLDYYVARPPQWRILMRSLWSMKPMFPSFASIGAVRSGTSQLSSYIMQHPYVVLPLSKELAHGRLFSLKKIMAQFPSQRAARANKRRHGGAITGYCVPIVPSLPWIYLSKRVFGDGKIIVILRNPVDRAISHWLWDSQLRALLPKDSLWRDLPEFESVLKLEQDALQSGSHGFPALAGIGAGYLQHGIYLQFLRVLFKERKRENIMVINASEFFANPIEVVRQVYAFLELPPVEPKVLVERNAGPAGAIKPATRVELVEFYRPLNEKLYAFLGRDMGWT